MHHALRRLLHKWGGFVDRDGLTYLFPLGVDEDGHNWIEFSLWDIQTVEDVCTVNDTLEKYSTPGARF